MNKIRLWPLRRDYHSGVLIGAGGGRRSDWSARVLANDVSTRIDRQLAREERSIARVKAQVAATVLWQIEFRFIRLTVLSWLQSPAISLSNQSMWRIIGMGNALEMYYWRDALEFHV